MQWKYFAFALKLLWNQNKYFSTMATNESVLSGKTLESVPQNDIYVGSSKHIAHSLKSEATSEVP